MRYQHTPVLLQQVVDTFAQKSGGKFIDATIGGGGHTQELLKLGNVLGIDQDIDAIAKVHQEFRQEIEEKKLTLANGNFKDIRAIADQNSFSKVSGILIDLGISSYQIDESGKGFSFMRNEPLDMRMNTNGEITAGEILNSYTEEELKQLFEKYGEEVNAEKIAKEIVKARTENKIETTQDFTQIIDRVVSRRGKISPYTKVFQALRIEVNNELESLKVALIDGFSLLDTNGILAVISFHSLEDRIVKRQFDEFVKKGVGKIESRKPIMASDSEVKVNNRARSAKLRIIIKN